jgi:predicted Zn-dependent protease
MQETEHLALYRLIFTALLVFLCNGYIYSQRYPDSEVDTLLESGIEHLLNQNYDSAKSDFLTLDKKYPSIPLGKIYLAVVDITKAYDYGDELNSEIIGKNLDDALELSETLIEKSPAYIWNYYFAALSTGYKAYLRVLNGEWLSAIANGLSSVNYFEDCLKMDSEFYESYVALGTYTYWKSRKLEFLEWLPFFDDESELGIKYLELAFNKASYNKNLAAVALSWIYIDNKNFPAAIKVIEKELQKNPMNRTLKWVLARAYEDVNPTKSIEVYDELLLSYQAIPGQNHFHELTLKHKMAQQYNKIGDKKEALRLCNEILSQQNLNENVKERLADRLERVEELRQELVK